MRQLETRSRKMEQNMYIHSVPWTVSSARSRGGISWSSRGRALQSCPWGCVCCMRGTARACWDRGGGVRRALFAGMSAHRCGDTRSTPTRSALHGAGKRERDGEGGMCDSVGRHNIHVLGLHQSLKNTNSHNTCTCTCMCMGRVNVWKRGGQLGWCVYMVSVLMAVHLFVPCKYMFSWQKQVHVATLSNFLGSHEGSLLMDVSCLFNLDYPFPPLTEKGTVCDFLG